MADATARKLGPEAARSQQRRIASGFIARYLSGEAILDIGYRGGDPEAVPVTDQAIGVDLDYPGYDGRRLPFDDRSQDTVFVSHCLEHIEDYAQALKDWYRVLKIGGFLVIAVPHQYLYERKATLPSRFNPDHKRFYTPASLLQEVETSLPVDGYRVRTLCDIDDGFDYSLAKTAHASGSYEIELVIQKISRPAWGPGVSWQRIDTLTATRYAEILVQYAAAIDDGRTDDQEHLARLLIADPPNFLLLKKYLPPEILARSRKMLTPIIKQIPFDAMGYAARHWDIRAKYADRPDLAHEHFYSHGYYEGRE